MMCENQTTVQGLLRHVLVCCKTLLSSYPLVQCAAVSTHSLVMRVPPQNHLLIMDKTGFGHEMQLQGDPSGLAQGFVDLDLGCSTILIGQ